MYRAAKVKGDINTMPDREGILVWMEGHMGIYVGNGLVIEATPKWKDGVQITKLTDRKWLGWCECPYITYEKDDDLAYYIYNIQQKIGLEDKTIQYLRDYKYGEELIKKIAKGLRQMLQLNYITSESMEPTILTGQKYIINKWYKFEKLKKGDIISFRVGNRLITHRIVEITNEGLKTKGDNPITNKKVDPWIVRKEDYIGKVIYIVKGLNLMEIILYTVKEKNNT